MTGHGHFSLPSLGNKTDLALFQGKALFIPTSTNLSGASPGEDVHPPVWMDQWVAYLGGSVGKASQGPGRWIKISQSGESTTEGRRSNSYKDPKAGKSWARWRQRAVSVGSVSESEEAVRGRSLPPLAGTKAQVSDLSASLGYHI